MKNLLIWATLIITVILVVWGMVKLAETSDNAIVAVAKEISKTDWVEGSREAKVILVEYSDLQCPYCAQYEPLVEAIHKEFGDQIAIVYRQFPLPLHQNSHLAAYAAEAAGQQGKFWEMVSTIFSNQNEWATSQNARNIFLGYAKELNLNLETFQSALDSPETKDAVEKQYSSGIQAGVNGTPTFFLDGKKISNPNDLSNLIRQKLNNP